MWYSIILALNISVKLGEKNWSCWSLHLFLASGKKLKILWWEVRSLYDVQVAAGGYSNTAELGEKKSDVQCTY